MSYNDDEELKIGEFEEDDEEETLDDEFSEPLDDEDEEDPLEKIADLDGSEF